MGCTLAGPSGELAAQVDGADLEARCVQGPRGTVWQFQADLERGVADTLDELAAEVHERAEGAQAQVQRFRLYREPGTSSWVSEWQEHGLGCAPDRQQVTFSVSGMAGHRVLGTVPVEPVAP